ncbi:MAG TPA: MarR family transcriptional regulator [Burkholderiaceae bacterium]|nr:MarR family transcriptional regulator [Burkholderiaceae bacterium]
MTPRPRRAAPRSVTRGAASAAPDIAPPALRKDRPAPDRAPIERTEIARSAAATPAPRRGPARRSRLGPVGKLEDFIPFKLAVVANRISQSIGHLFETRFNIQMPEWRILMALYAYGGMPFYELVARTSMDKARVSRAQRRLVDLRMIETRIDANDRRKLLLSISEIGARMCAEMLPAVAAREAWFLEALSDDEHHQFDIILDKLMVRSLGSE